MTTLAKLDAPIAALLRAEASDHIATINGALLSLEDGSLPADSALDEVLRAAHSLKGALGAVGLERVERAMHNWESCVQAVQSRGGALSPLQFDLLYRALDAIDAEVQASCTGKRPAVAVEPPSTSELKLAFDTAIEPLESVAPSVRSMRPVASESLRPEDTTLRVATVKVDALMTKIEELVQVRAGGPGTVDRSEALLDVVDQSVRAMAQLAQWGGAELRGNSPRVAEALLDLRGKLDDVARRSEALHLELRRHHARLDHVASGLHDDVRSVRMVPVRAAFAGLTRLVRDVSQKLGRTVQLEVRGAETEVDRDLLETVKDAVMHLVRNAIAHGIETPDVRMAAGKPERGRLVVSALAAAGGMQVTVSDDGGGIDAQKVLARALRVGLVSTSEAAGLSSEQIEQLVFRPGLSTADAVDSISGRGVGLDAVRALVERSGGAVSLRNNPGRGTEFVLRMPLNLTTMRVLLVRVGSARLALPSAMVAKIVRVGHAEVRPLDGGHAIEAEGRVYPIAHLGELVGLELPGERARRLPALLLSSGSDQAAVLVDGVDGELELIVKTLGYHLTHVPMIAGATVLPDGEIVPLVQASAVVQSARGRRDGSVPFASPDAQRTSVRRILVVDDSITTRTLEKSILEASGYHVETATDGMDALVRLNASPFDLVLSDVQMPRMGGIELVKHIKSQAAFRALPVVLVSSLDDQEDRRRGLDAGASAYLCKGEFRQDRLLDTLEKLL